MDIRGVSIKEILRELASVVLADGVSDGSYHYDDSGGGGGNMQQEGAVQQPPSVSDDLVDRLFRMLRSAQPTVIESHAGAVRRSLRQSILENQSLTTEGPTVAAKFDVSCDNLRRLHTQLYAPLLTMLAPLSFATSSTSISGINGGFNYSNTVAVGDNNSSNNNGSKNNNNNNSNRTNNISNHNYNLSIPSNDMPRSIEEIPQSATIDRSFAPDEQDILNALWVSPEIEIKLLRDLIFIFQDINGKFITYDPKSEQYQINESLSLSLPLRDLVLSLSEVGWLFGHINSFLKSVEKRKYSGLITQAFSFAIQNEMHDYYRLLAVLEQEIQRMERENGVNLITTAVTSSSSNREPGSGASTMTLTLLRLRAWMQSPLERLRIMAALVDVGGVLQGGALASKLYSYSKHGDSLVQTTLEKIMNHVSMPFNQMIVRWVLYGELHDPHQEFFIGANSSAFVGGGHGGERSASSSTALRVSNDWNDIYFLRSSMLPAFMPRDIAMKILVIGKTINFIQVRLANLPTYAGATSGFSSGSKSRSSSEVKRNKRPGNLQFFMTARAQRSGEKRVVAVPRRFGFTLNNSNYFDSNSNEEMNISTAGMSDEIDEYRSLQTRSNTLVNSGSRSRSPAQGGRVSNNSPSPNSNKYYNYSNSNSNGNGNGNKANDLGNLDERVDSEDFDVTQHLYDFIGSKMDHALLNLRKNEGSLELTQIIHNISDFTDKRLLRLLESKFHLSDHLEALKKYMLLSQGDLVTYLLDTISPELKKRANLLMVHNLNGILSSALSSSNAQFDPSYVLDRIGVKLSNATVGDYGWDIFTLDYEIDSPLNLIVHHEALSKYRVAFKMLWRLKRVSWTLSESWKQNMDRERISHEGGNASNLPMLRPLFHKCSLVRQHMMHLVNNFCEFIMFEVVETSWNELARALSTVTSLDKVIEAHDAYLSRILDRALLTHEHEQLNTQITFLLQSILKFCQMEEILLTESMAAISSRRAAKLSLKSVPSSSSSFSKFGLSQSLSSGGGGRGSNASSGSDNIDGVPKYVTDKLQLSIGEYEEQYKKVMQLLNKQSEGSNDYVQFLTFRLGFNENNAKGSI